MEKLHLAVSSVGNGSQPGSTQVGEHPSMISTSGVIGLDIQRHRMWADRFGYQGFQHSTGVGKLCLVLRWRLLLKVLLNWAWTIFCSAVFLPETLRVYSSHCITCGRRIEDMSRIRPRRSMHRFLILGSSCTDCLTVARGCCLRVFGGEGIDGVCWSARHRPLRWQKAAWALLAPVGQTS